MTEKERAIYNKGMETGWKLAWERIRELLRPIYKNTKEKPPKQTIVGAGVCGDDLIEMTGEIND